LKKKEIIQLENQPEKKKLLPAVEKSSRLLREKDKLLPIRIKSRTPGRKVVAPGRTKGKLLTGISKHE